jgi:uncharacterized membrane protein
MAAVANMVEKWRELRFRHHHRHPAIVNTNVEHEKSLTFGDRVSDRFATMMGSWTFIIIQSVILSFWVAVNVLAWIEHWDPYPFILLNLVLSFQAAYAAPIIMMSQNRQADKDRLAAEHDYQVNIKAEAEVKEIMHHLEQQDELMIDILHRLEEQHKEMLRRSEGSAT